MYVPVCVCACVNHTALVVFQHPHTSGDTDGQTFHSGLMQTPETQSQVQLMQVLTDPQTSRLKLGPQDHTGERTPLKTTDRAYNRQDVFD